MRHPDAEVLAEYRAGLISGRRGARIAAHLSGCDHCAAVGGQLAEISVLLAAAPVPAMPDGVARRLDTVLAAEAANRNGAERAGAGASRERAAHRRRTRRGGWRPVTVRVLAPAAAVVALAAVGFELSHIGASPSSSTASSAAGRAAAASRQAAPASSALRLGAAANGGESHPGVIPAFRSSPRYKVIYSGINYQPSTLRHQLETELVAAQRSPEAAGPAQPPSIQIKACVSRVTSGTKPGTPLLVERARYQGQPAIVIVASGRGGDPAWVTDLGCSYPGGVLDTTVLPSGISAP